MKREHETEYKRYRNVLNNVLHNAERQHYNTLLKENQHSMKNSWKILKEVINKKKQSALCSRFRVNNEYIDDKKAVSDGFNNFFVNVGANLAKKIPHISKSPTDLMKDRNVESIFLAPVLEDEVMKVIKNLKSASAGWDCISTVVVKTCYQCFVTPLTHIMHSSMTNGVFPDELKIARVVPLYKSGDSGIFSNYRPVSVLPVFSKILERLMYTRLLSFINKNKLLYKLQFGFREKHSPELALIYLVDQISKALENGEYVVGVFLDFSKAFDTVNHDILFKKLEMYGIRGLALNWFKSYLVNRCQFVEYNGVKSDEKVITCGVPQGSILGPLLFLIYINDLSQVSDKIFSLLFADDSNMFTSGKQVDTLIETMNSELEKVIEWLNVNKLSLNLKKTHYMIFRKRREKVLSSKELIMNGTKIDITCKTKFLGVMIDENLTFAPHLIYLKGKISRSLGILYKCRKYFDSDVLLTLYNSFIYPYFTYCISIWGNTYQTYLDPLIKLQKRAIRIIGGVDRRSHTSPLMQKYRLLPLRKIYIYAVQILMFRYNHCLLPDVFSDFFTRNSDIHSRVTRQINQFHVPLYKTTPLIRSFRCSGVTIYNYFYNKIDMYATIITYKKHLKGFLLDNDDTHTIFR